MCLTSAAGCSGVGVPGLDRSCRRAQSVLDLLIVEIGFTFRGFAEGDDADFIFDLRVNDRHWDAGQEAKRSEPPLTVGEAIVLKGEGCAFEDSRRVDEVKACSLRLIARLRSDHVNCI